MKNYNKNKISIENINKIINKKMLVDVRFF